MPVIYKFTLDTSHIQIYARCQSYTNLQCSGYTTWLNMGLHVSKSSKFSLQVPKKRSYFAVYQEKWVITTEM